MEKAKTIFSRVMAGLSAMIFIFGFLIFVSVLRASAGKVPSVLGFSFMQVCTGSMEPEYPIGSIVVARKIDAENLEKGDVISFYSTNNDISGEVCTHRIVEISHTAGGSKIFTTKGDANSDVDENPVSSLNVIGKVVINIGKAGGSVISVLQNPNVILFFIVLPLIFITFGEAVNLVNLVIKYKEEKDGFDEENSEEKKG